MEKTYEDWQYDSARSEQDTIAHYRRQRIINAILQSDLVARVDGSSATFILRTTKDFVIQVRPMLFNFRLLLSDPGDFGGDRHGFCYFGRGMDPLVRAIDAGTQWRDPLNTLPEGFDKQAF